MRRITIILVCILSLGHIEAQSDDQQLRNAITDLRSFLSIPNSGLSAADVKANIAWLQQELNERGFHTKEVPTLSNPILFGELAIDKGLPTVLFYMHLDGQAVDKSKWDQEDPFIPVLKKQNDQREWQQIEWSAMEHTIDYDWRIFARSASDDKMPIVAFLHALDHTDKADLKCNIKIIIDSEEELSSPNLTAAVKENLELLSADALIINDGPVHRSGQPTLVFGCRGITSFHITTWGPIRPQHSGHYGNYAPNPALMLSQLLASMKDEDGRVTIDGYYDGITLDKRTKQILANVPDDEDGILEYLQINTPDQVGANYQESLQYPSLNIRGMKSAWVGARARTIVPDMATAAIDIRLVPESDPTRLLQLVRDHIQDKGYHILDREPTTDERLAYPKIVTMATKGYTLPFRTDMDAPIGQWLTKAIQAKYNQDPVAIRIMGGTVPMAPFIKALEVPAVIVPMVNADNNQHSPNENVRLSYIANAMKTFNAIFTTSMKN